jgi:hypothetical protein
MKSPGGLGVGAIVGIVIGVIVCCVCCVAIVCFVWSRLPDDDDDDDDESSKSNRNNNGNYQPTNSENNNSNELPVKPTIPPMTNNASLQGQPASTKISFDDEPTTSPYVGKPAYTSKNAANNNNNNLNKPKPQPDVLTDSEKFLDDFLSEGAAHTMPSDRGGAGTLGDSSHYFNDQGLGFAAVVL